MKYIDWSNFPYWVLNTTKQVEVDAETYTSYTLDVIGYISCDRFISCDRTMDLLRHIDYRNKQGIFLPEKTAADTL